MSLVPYARLQSVRVVQGPVQRLLGLATVYADTAGGRAGQAHDRDLAEAWALAEQLAVRARQARGPSPAAPFPAHPGPVPAPNPATPVPYPPGPAQSYPPGPAQSYPPGPAQSYPAGPPRSYPAGPSQPYPAGPSQPYLPGPPQPNGATAEDETYWQRPAQS
jgi:putative membrane protein